MRTPDIDMESYALALMYGYTLDIGQVTKEQKRALEKQIRRGEVKRVRALFPDLLWGCSNRKMCYINTGKVIA